MEVILSPENVPPGVIVTLDQAFVRIEANSTVRVHGLLELDSDIIPPPSGVQRDDVKARPFFHLAAFANGDEYQVPIGGITYLVFPSRRVDVDIDVTMDADGNIHVTGTTKPPAPGQEFEIQVRYPSGRYVWIPVTTDGDGNIDETIPPEEEGTVRVVVKHPGGGGFAPTESGEDLVDTDEPPGALVDQLGLFFGGFLTDSDLPLTAGPKTGFNYRTPFRPQWSFEIEGALIFTEMASAGSTANGVLANGSIHLVRHLAGGQKVQPFALLGLSVYHWNGLGNSDTSLGASFGLGADFSWTSTVGFRADLRYVWIEDLFGSGSTGSWELLWGPTFSF